MPVYSASSVREALGKIAIVQSIGEAHRPTRGRGLLAPLAAHIKVAGFCIVFTLAAVILVLVINSIVSGLACAAVSVLWVYRTYQAHHRLPASIDERQLVEAALVCVSEHVPEEHLGHVTLDVEREGFLLEIRGTTHDRKIVVRHDDVTVDLLVLHGSSKEEHTVTVPFGDPHATDMTVTELRRWLSGALSRHFPQRSHATDTTPVLLTPSDPARMPTKEPTPLEIHTQHEAWTPPSRLAAAAVSGLYKIVFMLPSVALTGIFLLVMVVEFFDSGPQQGLFFLTVVVVYFSCVYGVNDEKRPATTGSRDALPPRAATVFTLQGATLTAALESELEDQVNIALDRPFASTFTRSADGIEPMTTTLELRQNRTRLRVGAKLSPHIDPDVLDRLEPWGVDAQILEGQDFAALVESIDFYARASGKGLPFHVEPEA